jgi:hypothetical protein
MDRLRCRPFGTISKRTVCVAWLGGRVCITAVADTALLLSDGSSGGLSKTHTRKLLRLLSEQNRIKPVPPEKRGARFQYKLTNTHRYKDIYAKLADPSAAAAAAAAAATIMV